MSMQKLIKLLLKLENDESIVSCNYLQDKIPIVNKIVNLANELLITNEGQCNSKNMSVLENYNFNIFPIEVDSFGWLIAGIHTNKGVVIYG
jgi:hypothetical protein